jgi:sulfur carrier protein
MSEGPGAVRVNGVLRPFAGRVVSQVVDELGLSDRPAIAVAVNGAVVPRGAWAELRVAAGDEVEIVGAAQGG